MPGRINFICVTPEQPTTAMGKAWITKVLLELDAGEIAQVLTLDILSGAESTGNWEDLRCEALGSNELLIVHSGSGFNSTISGPTFVFARRTAGWSITVSLEQAAMESLGVSGSRLLGRIGGATADVLSAAALAWGNELDLYEVGEAFAARNSDDLQQLCNAWRRDWRCRATMLIHSSVHESYPE